MFLADSGSVSIEVAIKMCLQYQRARGRPDRTRMMTWRGGYHGDTFAAMSVCDPEGGMHAAWSGFLPRQVFADRPPSPVGPALATPPTTSTCVPSPRPTPASWRASSSSPSCRARAACASTTRGTCARCGRSPTPTTCVLVFDEIATGFGRTGTLFAAEQAGVAPDVMCVGKALTGGYLTMAAALCTSAVATAVSEGEAGGLMHGPTFMANPLAATVAAASVDELLRRDWAGEVAGLGAGLREALAPARELPGVRDVRVLGGIGVVQLDHPVDVPAAQAAAEGVGVWLRPVPRPRLRHAALRHAGRRRPAHRGGDGRRGPCRMSVM